MGGGAPLPLLPFRPAPRCSHEYRGIGGGFDHAQDRLPSRLPRATGARSPPAPRLAPRTACRTRRHDPRRGRAAHRRDASAGWTPTTTACSTRPTARRPRAPGVRQHRRRQERLDQLRRVRRPARRARASRGAERRGPDEPRLRRRGMRGVWGGGWLARPTPTTTAPSPRPSSPPPRSPASTAPTPTRTARSASKNAAKRASSMRRDRRRGRPARDAG